MNGSGTAPSGSDNPVELCTVSTNPVELVLFLPF